MIIGLQEWAETTLDVTNERQTNRGFQVFAVCPFCGKGKDHFSVNVETGVYACYICGDGSANRSAGSYVDLVFALNPSLRKPSNTYDSPGRYYYAKKKVVDLFLKEHVSDISMDDLARIYDRTAITTPGGYKTSLSLLNEVEGTVSLDSGGFAKLACHYLTSRGVDIDYAMEQGMVVGTTKRYMGYLLIPVWESGLILSFVARAYLANSLRYTGPTLQEGWTPKSQLVYGIDSIRRDKSCIVVEGIFDALALRGLTTVALLGKVITTEQTRKLIDRKPSRVTVLLDAGFDSAAREVANHFVGFIPDIRIASMEDVGVDPSDSPEQAAKAIIHARSIFN